MDEDRWTKGYFTRGKWRPIEKLDVPKPFPFQVEDGGFLARRGRAGLFNEPGTGKTLTAAMAYKHVSRLYPRLALIVPGVAVRQWIALLRSAMPWVSIQHLSVGSEEIIKGIDIVVTTYTMLGRENGLVRRIRDWNPRAVILDESQELAGFNSKRTRAVYGDLCQGRDCLVDGVELVWPTTGTPLEGYYDDLYPTLRALKYSLLMQYGTSNFEAFKAKFCIVTPTEVSYGRMVNRITGFKNAADLKEMLYGKSGKGGFATQRLFKDIIPFLPPVREREVSLDIAVSPELDELMVSVAEDSTVIYDDEVFQRTNPNLSKAYQRLGWEKAPAVVKYIWDTNIEHALIGYWHTTTGERLYKLLKEKGFEVEIVRGDTHPDKVEQYKREFMAGEINIIIGQLKKMGTALDGLQVAAHNVIFAERYWSRTKNEQFFKRLWRIGQEHPVQVDYCIAADNELEDIQSRVISKKRAAQEQILND